MKPTRHHWAIVLIGCVITFLRTTIVLRDTDKAKARALLYRYGGTSMAHMITWRDNSVIGSRPTGSWSGIRSDRSVSRYQRPARCMPSAAVRVSAPLACVSRVALRWR